MKKLLLFFIILSLISPALVLSGTIKTTNVSGNVCYTKPPKTVWQALKPEMTLIKESSIRTETLSLADLEIDKNNKFRIMENTEIKIQALEDPETLESGKVIKLVSIKLYNGSIGAKLNKLPEGVRVNIEGPSAVAGAMGTGFIVCADKKILNTRVSVIDSNVMVSSFDSPDKSIVVTPLKEVAVTPWKSASLRARGTGVLSEAILGKLKIEKIKGAIPVYSEGTADNKENAKSAALFNLSEKIYSVKISDENTISDIVYCDPEIASKLLDEILNTKITACITNESGTVTAKAEIALDVIEKAINKKIAYVRIPVQRITLKEYGSKFGPLARVTTRRAAVIDGYRRLAEKIYGTVIDSKTTLNDYAIANDVIKQSVEGIVKGAQVVKEKYYSDGSITVEAIISGKRIVSEISSVKPDINFGTNYVSSPENITLKSYSSFRGI
ncbi:MAG: LPP20 family lipoprotein [Candidatus Aureabacteria bacterium]|nr:LPP20 family lipoprotein [Candidatus Auribacterota bacterium]